MSEDGAHGLSTGSVMFSSDNRADRPASVTGIAPGAELLPLRVAKPRGPIPAPVLFRTGTNKLRDAIWYALTKNVHIISISLGWLPNASLHRAIQHAWRQNVIVVAAAGNYTWRLVVWPGAYPEPITLAGCDSMRRPWTGSARGRSVDATGPAKNIWRADINDYVARSDGTSHATAATAGIAALWLSYHGRNALLQKYNPDVPLAEVFRKVLLESADPPPVADGRWGAGIVNAEACLQHPLPEAAAFLLEPFGAKPAVDPLQEAFAEVARPDLHRRVARSLHVPESSVPNLIDAHGRELRFWLVTEPATRERVLEGAPDEELESFGADATLGTFSPGLRKAIQAAQG